MRFVVFPTIICAWAAIVAHGVAAEPSAPATEQSTVDGSAAEPPVRSDPGAAEYWQALILLRSKDPGAVKTGREALAAAAAREYTHAQLLLGECYAGGNYGYPVDKKKAAALFRLAAERGNAFAQVSYGVCLFSGYGIRKDTAKATEWLAAATAANADYSFPSPPAGWRPPTPDTEAAPGIAGGAVIDPAATAQARAHYVLAVIADQTRKPTEAQTHYVAAAKAGEGRGGLQEAAFQAAANFAFGRGVPRDRGKALEMLTLGRSLVKRTAISLVHNGANAKLIDDFAVAEIEEAIAQETEAMAGELELGIANEFTDRKSKDYNASEAVQWYELAAERGKAWAMLNLAFIYFRGDLGSCDLSKAFHWFEQAGAGEPPKHYLAVSNLVICYENGLGVPRDPIKARQIAKKHADNDLVCYLTLKGECPKGILTFEQTVQLETTWAKERKDPFAQYLLGMRYLNGWGVEVDRDKGESWLKKAVQARLGPACAALGLFYEGLSLEEFFAKANQCYEIGAAVKDAHCLAYLASNTAAGRGAPRNRARAKALFEQSLAIDPKLALALNNLGHMYEQDYRAAVGIRPDEVVTELRDKMRDLYERADAVGFTYATVNLARLYSDASLGKLDLGKSYGYYSKAADQGDTEARFRLGEMHENGEGVPVTPVEAAYHYRLAALDGHREALRRLISFYLEGKAGTQDIERAGFWLAHAAQLGEKDYLETYVDVLLTRQMYSDAVTILDSLKTSEDKVVAGFAFERLSRCYAYGHGVKADQDRANKLRDKAAKLGNGDAIFAQGTERMLAKQTSDALTLFEEAAKMGSANANFALGQIYFHGQSVPADVPKSLSYLKAAANANHAGALFYLAALTANRVPGAPSLDDAITYASRSAALGHKDAGALRDKLERRRANGDKRQPTTSSRPS